MRRVSDTITGRILDLVDKSMLRTESDRQTSTRDLCIAIQDQLRLAHSYYDSQVTEGSIGAVAESVREALLMVEGGQDDSSENSRETGVPATPIQDLPPSIPLQRHQFKSSRINKSKKMGEVRQGRVAHRQEALTKDESQPRNAITEAAGLRRPIDGHRLEAKSVLTKPSVLNPTRLQPAGSPSVQNSTSNSATYPPLLIVPNVSAEKEVIGPPAHSISTTPSYGIPHTESPSREEFNLPARPPLQSYESTPDGPSRPPRTESQFTMHWPSDQFKLDPKWPICKEYQVLKNKEKGIMSLARRFKKDPDNFLKNFLVDRDIVSYQPSGF